MIKLTKSNNTPPTLQSAAVEQEKQQLTSIVAVGGKPSSKDFKSDLYGATDVKTQLLTDQHHKCCFCESTLLNQDGGEVEHFRPKAAVRQDTTPRNTQKPAYYQLAYDWDNLSAACHACNRRKGTLFPLRDNHTRFNLQAEEPLLINPYIDNPDQHLEFRQYKLYAKRDANGNKDEKGSLTIKYLGLNRKDLKELRRRHLSDFVRSMDREGLSFDDKLQQKKQDCIDDHIDPESIEFLGMYQNQKYKF